MRRIKQIGPTNLGEFPDSLEVLGLEGGLDGGIAVGNPLVNLGLLKGSDTNQLGIGGGRQEQRDRLGAHKGLLTDLETRQLRGRSRKKEKGT